MSDEKLAQLKASGSSQKGNKNRKYGRNSASAKRYTMENRHIRNKVRRLMSHLKRQPNDKQSFDVWAALK
jgi:hypothetical protein